MTNAMTTVRHIATIMVEHLGAWLAKLRAVFAGGVTVDANMITPQIWAGGTIETSSDVQWLVSRGVTADIDCQEEHDDRPELAAWPQVAYLWAPTADDGQRKPVEWFASAWRFAQPILNAGGVVLSHCQQGVNRGPSMAYFLLRAHYGYTPHQALDLLKQHRPKVNVAYAPDADDAIKALGLSSFVHRLAAAVPPGNEEAQVYPHVPARELPLSRRRAAGLEP